MRPRENEPPLAEPLAYFITVSTYGTWLPGDERGWIEYRHGWQFPDPVRKLEAAAKMSEDACWLDAGQRRAVEDQIAETCEVRGWRLHAVNCRTNHLHVVLTSKIEPRRTRSQLKAWCTPGIEETRRRAQQIRMPPKPRENWWAERGSQRFINDEESLEAAILYVRDGQDKPRLLTRNVSEDRRSCQRRPCEGCERGLRWLAWLVMLPHLRFGCASCQGVLFPWVRDPQPEVVVRR